MSNPDHNLGQKLPWQQGDLSAPLQLATNELHLWAVPLELSAAQSTSALALLNDQQRDKYFRRATAELRASYLAGRYFLMHLLGAYSGCSAAEVLLSYSRLNKPYLNPNPLQIAFNFSDSNFSGSGMGLFAFCRHRNVGVDIEALARRSNFSAIVERKFSAAEQRIVGLDANQISAEKFLAIWTRKEAYGKATGQGINFKMNQLDIASPGQHQLAFAGLGEHADAHFLEQFYVGAKHIACVAYSGSGPLTLRAFELG